MNVAGVTTGSTVSGQVTLSATTSQAGIAKYLTYRVSDPSYTEVYGGAETAGTGTGVQFAGVNVATATLADGSYTVTPRITLQNGGTQDFSAVSFMRGALANSGRWQDGPLAGAEGVGSAWGPGARRSNLLRSRAAGY